MAAPRPEDLLFGPAGRTSSEEQILRFSSLRSVKHQDDGRRFA